MSQKVCNDSEEINIAQEEIICSSQDSTQLYIPFEDSVNINMCNDEYRYISSSDNTFLSENGQSEISDIEYNNIKRNDRFVADIITWVKQCKPPGKSVNSLLQILRKHTNVAFPKDYRTLLKTPKRTEVTGIDKG